MPSDTGLAGGGAKVGFQFEQDMPGGSERGGDVGALTSQKTKRFCVWVLHVHKHAVRTEWNCAIGPRVEQDVKGT